MTARILHCGGDDCNRLAVLETAGYRVENCRSLPGLVTTLGDGVDTDAVILTEDYGDPSEDFVRAARGSTEAPLILFQSADCRCNELEFDLVIPMLTPPRHWLAKMAATIEKSRAIRAERLALAESSKRLRQESEAARESCAKVRQKIRETCGRTEPPAGNK